MLCPRKLPRGQGRAGIPQGSPLGEVLHRPASRSCARRTPGSLPCPRPGGSHCSCRARSSRFAARSRCQAQLSLGKVTTGVQGKALLLAQAPQGRPERSSGSRRDPARPVRGPEGPGRLRGAGPGRLRGRGLGSGGGAGACRPRPSRVGVNAGRGAGPPSTAPLPLAVWRRGRARCRARRCHWLAARRGRARRW